MINTKTLKLNKEKNVNLIKRIQINEKYKKYLENLIMRAEKSIKLGKTKPIECLIQEIEETYGMMPK